MPTGSEMVPCLLGCVVGDLHRRDRQHLSSSQLTGGGVHAAHQDGASEADGGGGHVPRCQQHLPHVCHQLSLGARPRLPTSFPEKDLHPSARQVKSGARPSRQAFISASIRAVVC